MAKSWGGLNPIESFFFLFISRFNNKMWLQSSLPLQVTQAYKDQIVIFALNQNYTELVQDFTLPWPHYDLLLSPALSNRIKKIQSSRKL